MLKRKLPSFMDGRKIAKGVTLRVNADRNLMFQQLFDILRKLRGMVRDQAPIAPDTIYVAERAHGVKRANLLDPKD